MATDRDRLERTIRDRLDDLDLRERLDPGAVRERLDAFYVRYFMPPSVKDEHGAEEPASPAARDHEGFDFGAWLQEGRASGPAEPPAEARVVTDAAETGTEASTGDYDGFAFGEWLAEGEAYEPIEVGEPEGEPTAGAPTAEPVERPTVEAPSAGLHPAKAATFALFLAVATLTVLSIVGYLPPLGPDVGLSG